MKRPVSKATSWEGTVVEIAELENLWTRFTPYSHDYAADYQVMYERSWVTLTGQLAAHAGAKVSASEAKKFFAAGCKQLPRCLLKEEFVELVVFFVGELNPRVVFGASVLRYGQPPQDFIESELAEPDDCADCAVAASSSAD